MIAKKPEKMIRLNSRVRKDQHIFIKKIAKSSKQSEGEVLRMMVDFYMNPNVKK